MKHKQPENVKKYFEAIKTPIPKCCHTCESYTADGICSVYDMQPPEDFAAAEGGCQEWEALIPF